MTWGSGSVDTSKELPTVLSLCSGYGGLERGLDLAGVEHRVLAYVEIEAYAIALMAKKMANGVIPPAPIYTNLKTLPVEPFRGRVDILTAGYPCQPFSAAGKRAGKEDPRHLWPYIVDIIRAVRPVRCCFENVEGHISLGLREVIADLEGLGYSTAWGIFSAREVGAPHQRKRVFIMADSNGGQCELAEQEIQAGGIAVTNGSAELGNAASIRRRGWANGTELKGSAIFQERSDEDVRCKSQRSSQALADTRSEGSQGGCQRESSARKVKAGRQGAHGDFGCICGVSRNLWPSRPGQDQHAWEARRTLEPRIRGASDGCADRVDIIRLLGNGVVPPTAAKAWRVLNGESSRNY